MSASVILVSLQTAVLVLLRAAFFFAARKYLLHSLYHDLQDLSTEVEPLLAAQDGDVELETLPTPSSATTPSGSSASGTRKRALHSTISRALFALCFSESLTLFILLMFQALDILNPRSRLFNWQISLCLLLASIVVLIPLSYSLILSYRSASSLQGLHRPTPWRMAFFALPIAGFLFLLSFIPIPAGANSSGVTGATLSRLTAVGTVILGALSGFGAVENAWRYFPRFTGKPSKLVTEQDVSVAEEGLRRVQSELIERQKAAQRLRASQPKTDASWFSRVVPSFGGSELSNVTQELAGLEALEYQMSRNLRALKRQQAEAQFSRTWTGRVVNGGGRLFALYCIYRTVVSIINLVIPARSTAPDGDDGSSRTDFITICLARLLALIPGVHVETTNLAVMARQISLVLVGVIILSSIRLVLRGVARVLRVTSRNLGASLMLLILAQLMGVYLLTTLIQLRTSFPPPPSRLDTEIDTGVVNLFSTLPEYQVFGSLFDGTFLLAAGLSAVVRWFNQRINNFGVIDDS